MFSVIISETTHNYILPKAFVNMSESVIAKNCDFMFPCTRMKLSTVVRTGKDWCISLCKSGSNLIELYFPLHQNEYKNVERRGTEWIGTECKNKSHGTTEYKQLNCTTNTTKINHSNLLGTPRSGRFEPLFAIGLCRNWDGTRSIRTNAGSAKSDAVLSEESRQNEALSTQKAQYNVVLARRFECID